MKLQIPWFSVLPMNGTELKSLTWFSPLLNIIALLSGLLLWWYLNNWDSLLGVQDIENIPLGKADLLLLWLPPENMSCLNLDREGLDWDFTFFHESGIENLGNPLFPILKLDKYFQNFHLKSFFYPPCQVHFEPRWILKIRLATSFANLWITLSLPLEHYDHG